MILTNHSIPQGQTIASFLSTSCLFSATTMGSTLPTSHFTELFFEELLTHFAPFFRIWMICRDGNSAIYPGLSVCTERREHHHVTYLRAQSINPPPFVYTNFAKVVKASYLQIERDAYIRPDLNRINAKAHLCSRYASLRHIPLYAFCIPGHFCWVSPQGK